MNFVRKLRNSDECEEIFTNSHLVKRPTLRVLITKAIFENFLQDGYRFNTPL